MPVVYAAVTCRDGGGTLSSTMLPYGGSELSMLLHRRHPMMLHAQRPAHLTAVGLALLAAG